MSTPLLFDSLTIGDLTLPNRMVMAPVTRMRAGPGSTPTALNAAYYAQRASAGLQITEATGVSPEGRGYPNMPGVYTPQQIEGWRLVTDAVHAAGGRIVLQIVHHGRWSHSSYSDDGSVPVAPSAIASAVGQAFTSDGQFRPFETPRALDAAELPGIVEQFKRAARHAVEAGFDMVEIHGANGFLLDQFLQDGSNHRTDGYGGSISNRARLLLDVVDSVSKAIGSHRVAVRLSPYGNLGGLSDSDPVALFRHVIQQLSGRIAYLHLIEPRASSAGLGDDASVDSSNNAMAFRRAFVGPVITAGGYRRETAEAAITEGDADAVAFGRLYIANPDLVARFKAGATLNPYDRSTFYGGSEHGYTDYPTLDEVCTPTR